jgi:hypothetical protein
MFVQASGWIGASGMQRGASMPLGRPRGRGSVAGVGCRERGNEKLLSDPLLILDPRC